MVVGQLAEASAAHVHELSALSSSLEAGHRLYVEQLEQQRKDAHAQELAVRDKAAQVRASANEQK